MAENIVMFALSPTMDKGTILKWHKKEGDAITKGEIICEVETDKSSMDYESVNEGVLLKIIVNEGEGAEVGKSIAIVGEQGENIDAMIGEIEKESSVSTSENSAAQETTSSANEVNNTSKAESKSLVSTQNQNPSAVVESTQVITSKIRIKASPLAQKLAAEKGIPLSQIKGTGPGGRIVRKDVMNAPTEMVHSKPSGGMPSQMNISTPVKGVRSVIAQRLAESKFSAPHFYVKNTVRIEEMMALRERMNKSLPEKLSLNAFVIGFVAQAIKYYPEINSSWQGDTIVQYGSIDIGLAVDLGSGLFTPVIRDCGNKGIYSIDKELKILIEKVREKTIAAADYTGATFTISNLGTFGVDEFTAIINPPGSAILAVGRGRKVPVVNKQGELEVGDIMSVSLSSDHRVIDGALAGRFISKLQAIIEHPGLALL